MNGGIIIKTVLKSAEQLGHCRWNSINSEVEKISKLKKSILLEALASSAFTEEPSSLQK